MKEFKFTKKTPLEILGSNESGILNFQNMYSLYLFNNNRIFRKAILSTNNFVFPDGKVLSFFLRTNQIRGPSFTKDFLKNTIAERKKHFFIGLTEKELNKLKRQHNLPKKTKSYNPSYPKGILFPRDEIEKIIKQLKKFKPNYVWICIGNPKQEILANQLYKKHKSFYFSVGAAMDFLLSKKKESPLTFRKLGLEWFYRLLTDFKYSRKKVWKSLLGLKYIGNIKIK